MTRLYNREALAVLFLGLVLVITIGWLNDLGRITLMMVAGWLVAALPIAMRVQNALIPLYLKKGYEQRALDLAVDIRDSAANRKGRDLASIDVSMIQAAMGRFPEALKTLEGIKDEYFGELPQALILANRAWCRAHLGKNLDKALKETREALALAKEEKLLAYFEGLVLHKQGNQPEAEKAVEESLNGDPDPMLPTPGERALILGDIHLELGDRDKALDCWKKARDQARGKGPFASRIAERLEKQD